MSSANAILFEAQGNFFQFDGQRGYDPDFVFSRTNRVYGQEQNALMVPVPVDPGDKYVALDAQGIGQLIAFAMANDITSINFRNCTVTVNYLVKMLQFKGRHGWFIDVLDDTAQLRRRHRERLEGTGGLRPLLRQPARLTALLRGSDDRRLGVRGGESRVGH